MAQVSLQINGYAYILGCGDGEEAHLRTLAHDLNRRIDNIKAATGPSGEARMLLMAALMLSDELHDLRLRADGQAPAADAKAARRIRNAAKRAEQIAAAADTPPLTAAMEAAPTQAPILGAVPIEPAVDQA